MFRINLLLPTLSGRFGFRYSILEIFLKAINEDRQSKCSATEKLSVGLVDQKVSTCQLTTAISQGFFTSASDRYPV